MDSGGVDTKQAKRGNELPWPNRFSLAAAGEGSRRGSFPNCVVLFATER